MKRKICMAIALILLAACGKAKSAVTPQAVEAAPLEQPVETAKEPPFCVK